MLSQIIWRIPVPAAQGMGGGGYMRKYSKFYGFRNTVIIVWCPKMHLTLKKQISDITAVNVNLDWTTVT